MSNYTTLEVRKLPTPPEKERRRPWELVALLVILLVAAGLYTWRLSENGWANAYYSAAVQSGLHDPTAFFFGSADWGNSISVDKPPLSLWIMGLSVRLFGLNTWALLLPQAAMTLGSTLMIFQLARKYLPSYAALVAAFVFATTPITVLLARYNNPDPLMILLMLSALYAGIRATETARSRWLYFAAGLLALGFLAKQLQAFMVLPALGLVFCLFVGRPWRKVATSLSVAGLILAAGSMAWPIIVDLTPTSSRPYVGGSKTNSMIDLTLGYNGLDRLLQQQGGRSAALTPQEFQGASSDAGLFRLFNANYGQEAAWLLLPALVVAVVVIVRSIQRRRTSDRPILMVAAATWMISAYLVLSFMGNSIHSYYTASLVAPMALCIGIGSKLLVSSSTSIARRAGTSVALLLAALFANLIWGLSPSNPASVAQVLLLVTLVATSALTVPTPYKWLTPLAGSVALASLLVGPIVGSLVTVSTPQQGSNPLSGGLTRSPASLSHFLYQVKNGDPAGVHELAIGSTPGPGLEAYLRATPSRCKWAGATYPGQTAAQFQLSIGRPIMPLGGFAATDPSPTLAAFQNLVRTGQVCSYILQPEQLKIPGVSDELVAIHNWVSETFPAKEIDGIRVYDLAGQNTRP
ncbi:MULTISPECIES: ArnT family glycosyltransferase [unclassified Arthrobacter]|uniref:ArnT family glycosyltransferase n=1 Tax=unclassified Arthrobacter TaxID=235627 RepID=UPI00039E73A9|nr:MULTISPECIES: glycosyltransferase family 39 protein [unclassified Arthrobacter]